MIKTIASKLALPFSAWNRFWFGKADPTTLCFIRILAGFTVFAVHLAYNLDLQEFFGKDAWVSVDLANETRQMVPAAVPPLDWQYCVPPIPTDPQQSANLDNYIQRWGVHPDLALGFGNFTWSIWYHTTDPVAMGWLHGAIVTAMFLFAIGFATRVTSVLAWAGALQYVHRNGAVLFGMDQMMIILLLYLMIGPSGAVLSVDSWLARRGCKWARLLGGSAEPSTSANLALRLLQVHMCFIYAAAGLAKLLGSSWWSGTALWYTVANYEFSWLRYPGYAAVLRWLCYHRVLWELVMSFGVLYTILLQISFPYLVWRPRWRWLMVSGSILLHTTISVLMGLLAFGLFMVAMAVAFVPSEVVRQLLCKCDVPDQSLQGLPRANELLVAAA